MVVARYFLTSLSRATCGGCFSVLRARRASNPRLASSTGSGASRCARANVIHGERVPSQSALLFRSGDFYHHGAAALRCRRALAAPRGVRDVASNLRTPADFRVSPPTPIFLVPIFCFFATAAFPESRAARASSGIRIRAVDSYKISGAQREHTGKGGKNQKRQAAAREEGVRKKNGGRKYERGCGQIG